MKTATNNSLTALQKINLIVDEQRLTFLERDDELQLIWETITAGQNFFMLGMPGTAKSALIHDTGSRLVGANVFGQQFHPQLPSSHVTGPESAKGLLNDELRYVTKGRAPEAHLLTLTEVGRASPTTLDAMLSMINPEERTFFQNGSHEQTPIISAFCDSNTMINQDENMGALWDRLTVRKAVQDVVDPDNILALITGSVAKSRPNGKTTISLEEIQQMREEVRQVSLPSAIAEHLRDIVTQLRTQGFTISSRTIVALMGDLDLQTAEQRASLLKARAYLKGRDEVNEEDLLILQHTMWDKPEDQSVIRNVVSEIACPAYLKIAELSDEVSEIWGTAQNTEDPDTLHRAGVQLRKKMMEVKTLDQKIDGVASLGREIAKMRASIMRKLG